MGTIYKFEREMLRGGLIHVNKKRNQTWFKKHWHNYFEIIYYNGCKGYCNLNGEKFVLSENCLFLLTPKDFHEIVTEEVTGSHSIIISFSEQIVDDQLLGAITADPIALYGLSDTLRGEIESLYTVFAGASPYRERHLAHLLNCILIGILEEGHSASSLSRDLNPIVRKSIVYMLTNPAEQISLQTFADEFGVTKTYFSHLFHDSTGVAFKQYLTDLRIECAKRMLEEKALPIIDVGYECGFNTPSQFNRVFKHATGITPSQYRTKTTRPK
ncbi:MAG: helix-turn-helix transcriptional regulator [Clostridia bacterium]|nr:helix-turn-helix transcriptional regulator [Clostridia bacterium]